MRVARVKMIRGLDHPLLINQKQYEYLCPMKNVEVGDCVVVTIFIENIDSFACAKIEELIDMDEEEVVKKRIYGICVVKLPPNFIQHCNRLKKARRRYLATNGIIYRLRDPKAIAYEIKMREQRLAKKQALLEEEQAKEQEIENEAGEVTEKVINKQIIIDENLPVEEQLKCLQEQILVEGKIKKKRRLKYTSKLLDILQHHPDVKPSGMLTREWISLYIGCSPRTVQNDFKILDKKTQKKAKKRAKAKEKEKAKELANKEEQLGERID